MYVADTNSRPTVTSDKPFLPPAPVREGMAPPSLPDFSVADLVNAQGQALIVAGAPLVVLQSPYAVVNGDFNLGPPTNGTVTLTDAGAVDAVCDAAGACQKLNFTGPGGINFNRVAALNVENGFDGIIGWGRWAQDPARPNDPAYTASGSGNTADAILALDYAVTMGADVLSLSWGGAGVSQVIEDALQNAAARGCVICALDQESDITVSISDVYGKEIASFQRKNISGEFKETVVCEKYPAGVYFISLTMGNKKSIRKAVHH